MLGKVLALSTLCAFVLLSALMQSTTPSTIHPVGILFVFILLYVLALGVLTFFIFTGSGMVRKLRRNKTGLVPATLKRSYIYGSVLALAPIMMVGMASIGKLGFYEILLVIAFEAAACFYVARQR